MIKYEIYETKLKIKAWANKTLYQKAGIQCTTAMGDYFATGSLKIFLYTAFFNLWIKPAVNITWW